MEKKVKRLGELLVEDGHLLPEQVEAVLKKQKSRPTVPFGQLAVELGFITRSQLDYLLVRYGKRLPLGQILLNANLVNQDQLQSAYETQRRKGGRLGEILVKLGFLGEIELCETLARQFNLPFVPLSHMNPPKELRALVNPMYASRNRIIPIALLGERLTLAISDPTQDGYLNDVQGMTGLSVDMILACPSDIAFLYERLYGRPITSIPDAPHKSNGDSRTPTRADKPSVGEIEADGVGNAGLMETEDPPYDLVSGEDPAGGLNEFREETIEDLEALPSSDDSDLEILDEEVDAVRSQYTLSLEDSPVARTIVQTILSRALTRRASDIHLEIFASGPRLRLRIDGMLRGIRLGPLQPLYRKNYRSVISRLKVMASMDIAERRRPQGGSFRMMNRRSGQLSSVDFRLSTLPSRFGEGMVIRVLDQLQSMQSLPNLGLTAEILESFRSLVRKPTGIILITGPTGSGKSSTLFAALRSLYRPDIKIVTAEDPIEYTIPGIVQAEVNSVIGNSFGSYLREFLRQDPDVIMVGEIRDSETAEMALRAAQTGHLLLSTLHTNNATASAHRLYDLFQDSNSIASNLIGVMAQRLVRKNCTACSERYQPEPAILVEWFGQDIPDHHWLRGSGCELCGGVGYVGRMCVAELWIPSNEEATMMSRRASSDELRQAFLARAPSIAADALRKAVEGATTPEEALRVVPYEDVARLRGRGAASILDSTRETDRVSGSICESTESGAWKAAA